MFDNLLLESILKKKSQPAPSALVDFGTMSAKASHQWLFNMQDNEEGWSANPNTRVEFASKDGLLNIYFNADADAYILSPEQLDIDSSTYTHILIRLKFEPGTYTNHTFTVNWVLDAGEAFVSSTAVGVDTTAKEDGEFYEYDIDLSADNNWLSNNIYQLRFDFDDRSEKNIYIDYIRVQSSNDSVAAKSIQLLQADGFMPTIFRDHLDNVWAAWLKSLAAGSVKTKTWTTDADFNTGTKSQVVVGSNQVILATTAGWLSGGYTKRKAVTIAAGAGAGTNYQVKLKVGESSGSSGAQVHCGGNALSFPNDIRFTSADGETLLDYWVESSAGATPNITLTVWVEIKEDLEANKNIYLYYRKAGDASASNGDNTFVFFDDFPGVALDGAKWSLVNTPTITVSGGICTIYKATGSGGIQSVSAAFGTNRFRTYSRAKETNKIHNDVCGLGDAVVGTNLAIIQLWSDTKRYYTNTKAGTNTQTNPGTYDTSYHIWEVLHKRNVSTKYSMDDGAATTHTTNIYDAADYIQIMVNGGGTQYIDWYFISKYVASEPAFSSAGVEETGSVGYYANGYDELIYDGGETIDWTTYDFSVGLLEPANTNIKIKCATSDDNISYSGWSSWFDTSTGALTGVVNSRYIKVQAYLETTDSAFTPTLAELTINGTTLPTYPIKYKKYTGSAWGSETTLVTDATEYANNICLYENNANQMELIYALDSNVYRTYYNSGWQTPISVVTHTSGDMRCWAFKGADAYDYIYYSYVSGGNYYIKYKSSVDNYAAENSVLISTSKIKNICVYEDDKNVAWLVYEQYDNYTSRPTFIHLYCKKSVDYGVNWGSATKISSTEETKENLWLCGLDKLMALDEEDNWETVVNSASPYKGVNYKGKVYLVDSFKSRLDGVIASDSNKLYKFDGADWSTNHDFSADTPAEKAYDIIEAGDYLWILGAAYVSKYDGTTLTKLNTAAIACANESYTFGEIGLCFGGLPIYCGGGKVAANTGKYYKFIAYVGWAGQIGAAISLVSIMESYYYEDELYIVALVYEAVYGEYWGMRIYKFNNSTVAFPFDLIYDDDASTGYRYGGVSNYFVTSKMRFLNGVPYLLMVGGDSSGTVINSRVYNLIDYSVSESLSGATLNNFIRTIYDWKGEKYYIAKQTTWKLFKYDESNAVWEEDETAPCQVVDSIKVKVPLQHSYPRILQTNEGQILVYYQNNKNYYREPGKMQGILIGRDSSLNVGDINQVSFVNRKINLGFDVDDWTDTEKVSIFSTYNSITDKYDIRYQVLEKINLDSAWSSHYKVKNEIRRITIELTDESQAGTFSVELDNSDDNFSPDNYDSSVWGYLEENKDIRLSLGFLNNLQLLMTGLIDEINCEYTPDGAKTTKITGKDYWKKLLDVPITLTVGEDKKIANKNSDILIKHVSGNTATDAIRTVSVITPSATIYSLSIPVTFIVPQYDTVTNYEIKLENISPVYSAGDYDWAWEHEGTVDKLSPGYFIKVKMLAVNYNAPRITFDLVGTSRTDASTKTFGTFEANYESPNVTLIETGSVTNGAVSGWNNGMSYYIWDILINIPSKDIDDDYDLTITNVSHNLPAHTPEYLVCEVAYPDYVEKAAIHNKVIKTYINILTANAADFDFSFDLRVVYANDNTQVIQVRPTKEELFNKLCDEVGITNSEFLEPIRDTLPKVSFIEENAIDCFEKLRQVCWDSENKLYKLYFNNYGKLILKPIFEDYIWYSKLWTTSTDWLTHSAIDDVTIYDGSIELTLSGTPMGDVGFYYPPDIPEDEGWTKVLSGTASRTITGIYYETSGGNGNYLFYYADPSFVSANGWVFEFKAKIDANPQNDYWSDTSPWGTFIAYGQDNSKSCALSLVNGQKIGSPRINRIVLHSDNYGAPSILGTIYATYDCDVTVYATYKVFVLNNYAWVYRNGVEVMTAIPLTANDNHYAHKFLWGDVTSHVSKANKEWLTYIKYQAATSGEWKYEGDGYIRLQKDAGEEVHWDNYLITKITPASTDAILCFRTAPTQTDLATTKWSKWYTDTNGKLDIPNNRWLEVYLRLHTTNTAVTPIVDDLTINYRSITVQRNMVWTFTEDQDIIQLSKPLRDIELVTRVKVTGAEGEVKEVIYPEKRFYTAHELTVGNHGDKDEYRLYFKSDNGAVKVDPSSIRVTEDSSSDATWIMESVSSDNVEIWVYNTNWWHTGWVKLNVYAKPIGDAVPTAIYKVETDISAKRLYGLKQEDIQNPLIATEEEAGYLALAVLEESKLDKNTVEFETQAGLLIEPGDFITVIHTDSDTNNCYRIRKVTHELSVSEEGNKLTTRLLALKIT